MTAAPTPRPARSARRAGPRSAFAAWRGRRYGRVFVARRVLRNRWRRRRVRGREAAVACRSVDWAGIDPDRIEVREVIPAREFVTAAPPDLDAWLVDAPGWHLRHGLEPTEVAVVRDGWVFGTGGWVGVDAGTLCAACNRGVFSSAAAACADATAAVARGTERLPGTTVSALAAGGGNYFHWMLQGLPMLLTALGEQPIAGVDRVLVPAGPGFVRETVARAGVPDEVVVEVASDSPAFVAERLVVATVQLAWNPTPVESLRAVRDCFAAELAGPAGDDLLYLRRAGRGRDRRTIVNEDELVAGLEELGFETLATEGTTVAEQATRFAQARAVVGLHGAGLTNLVFTRPGTLAVEIHPANASSSVYFQLARQLDLDYRAVVGIEPRPPRRLRTFMVDADAIVDVAGVQRMVATALGSAPGATR